MGNSITLLVIILLISCTYHVSTGATFTPPPPDWLKRVLQAQMLYAEQEPTNLQLFPYVGNGYIATQISSDSIYVGGVFNGPADSPKDPSHRARIPSLVNFEVVAAYRGSKQVRNDIKVIGCALDIERGIYFRRVQITDPLHSSTNDEAVVLLEQRWYAHRQYRNLLVHEIYPIHPIRTPLLRVCLSQNTGNASEDVSLKSFQNSTSYQSWIGSTLIPEVDSFPLVGLAVVTTSLNQTNGTHCVNFTPDSILPSTYLFMVNTTLDGRDNESTPIQRILSDSIHSFGAFHKLATIPSKKYASEISMSHALLDSHIDAWSQVWTSGMEVRSTLVDDIQLARAINSSQYYILSSVRDDWPYSLSPGSLSSDAYHGHVFWDTETWIYPSLLVLHPLIAQYGILQYRVDRIKAAEEKAKSYIGKGYSGAMFPWESAASGVETCPTVAPTGLLEQHISGDIVFAIKQFYRTQVERTEEIQFKNQFLQLVVQVARFYASRVTPRPNSSLFDINGVIPPDEYAVNVNNSIYTNVIAQISLSFAVELVNKFKDPSVPLSEVRMWDNIAKNLFMPYDAEKGIHPEYEGYQGEMIKQADVALLKFPLMWSGYDSVPQSVRADLEYYEKVTDIKEGPAMTFGMYAVGWIDEGELERATPLFEKSYANAHEPFGVWMETPTGGAVNFITGAGGFLQSVLFGYGGLRIMDTSASNVRKIKFNPMLPSNISFVRLRGIHFMGNVFSVGYDHEKISISCSVLSRATSTFIEYPNGRVERLAYDHNFARGDGPFFIFAL